MREPNQQQRLFYKYYVLYGACKGAGSKAAREANYSSKNAGGAASQLLKRPDAQKWIELEKKALAEKVEMETTEIISRYQDMARKMGDYSNATVTEAERALKQLGKYKSMQGFTDKVIIEKEIPFKSKEIWTVEALIEFIQTGKMPEGAELPNLESISPLISRILSQKSGESIN